MEDSTFDEQLKKAITAEERKHQKRYLKSIENSIEKPSKTNWFVAASIIIIISLGSYLAVFNQSMSSDELYDSYFSPYENVVDPIVRSQEKRTKKQLVFASYELGEYQKAIEGFNQLLPQDATDVATLNFYKANAYLQLKEYQKAQPLFAEIVVSKNQDWKTESLWYLGLIFIKLNKFTKAKKYFQELKKQNYQFYKSKEVENLLKELD